MEIQIIKYIQALKSPFFDGAMWFFTYLASFYAIILFFIIFFFFASKKYSFLFLISALTNVGINFILKLLINRPRPYEISGDVSNITNSLGKSMPSGHMVSITTILFFLIFFLFKRLKTKLSKTILVVSSAIIITLVAISRMYFGQHYISDLVVGFVEALILCSIELKFEQKYKFVWHTIKIFIKYKWREQLTKTKKLKIVYWIVYFAILVATAFFIYFLISNAIIQKQARDYYEQSWQYVADTNLELVTEENEDGTTETYYAISSPEQLAGMFELSNSKSVSAESVNTYNYKLTQNIDLSGKNWVVNDFSKVFNGNSHHIQNLRVDNTSSNYLGFVKSLTGTITNLYFDNIYISSLSTSNGNKYVGGVAAYMSGGSIENVYVNSGSIYGAHFNQNYSSRSAYTGGIVGYIYRGSIKKCINYAAVYYGYSIGGIAGESNGTIEQCINKGYINYADSSGNSVYLGGISGRASSTIRLCQNLADVRISAYSTTIKYTAYMGGIVGYTSANISECSNSGSLSQGGRSLSINNINAGGIVGFSAEKLNNCINTGSISAKADTKTSSSAYNISTKKVDETEYHSHTYFFWGWATDWLWYTREKASINIVEMNAYAGGIVGNGLAKISNCYNSGTISGGFKEIKISINEVLKKDSKYLSFAGSNMVTKTRTSTFSVCTAIKTGAINGSDTKTCNSGSSVSNSLSLSKKCSFNTGSYYTSTAFHYEYFVGGFIISTYIGGESNETASDEFTALEVGMKDCNGNSQSAGRVVHKVTKTNNSYTVYTYPERMYESDKVWLRDKLTDSSTMLQIRDIDTTIVKDNNVKFIDSFTSSNLSTLGTSNWEMVNGEPRLKNLYW